MNNNNPKIKTVHDTEVIVTLPDKVTIDFVPANELKHYELFQWLAGISSTIAVGFWVSWFTIESNSGLKFSALAFSLFTIIFIIQALRHRSRIFNGKVQKSMRLGEFKQLCKMNKPKNLKKNMI